jgi:hypothetical protein
MEMKKEKEKEMSWAMESLEQVFQTECHFGPPPPTKPEIVREGDLITRCQYEFSSAVSKAMCDIFLPPIKVDKDGKMVPSWAHKRPKDAAEFADAICNAFDPTSEAKFSTCDTCGSMFASRNRLFRHLREVNFHKELSQMAAEDKASQEEDQRKQDRFDRIHAKMKQECPGMYDDLTRHTDLYEYTRK